MVCNVELNRLQKVLEGANVKLTSVLRDVQGKSARKLLDRLAADQQLELEDVSKLIHKSLRSKLEEITLSVESITTPLQRALLRQILDHIDDLNRRVAVLDEMVEQYMTEYSILTAIWHILKYNVPYHSLGAITTTAFTASRKSGLI